MTVQTRKVDAKGRVTLPESFAGMTVTVSQISDCEVRIATRREPRKRYSLPQLLAGITDENRHEAVDFGPPTGEEKL